MQLPRNKKPLIPAYYNLTISSGDPKWLALLCIPFYNHIMNQAFHLYRLQQIDTQIDQAEASAAELDRLLSGDETIRQTTTAAEAAGTALHQAQQRLKQTEFAVQEQQLKIAQSEAKLYSGKLHNPKELQDLQKEIASLKKYLAVLEDQQLEAMLSLEEHESQHAAAKNDLNNAQAAFAEKSAAWRGQRDQLTRNLDRLHSERNASLSLIDSESLKTYDAMRKRKSGVAVTIAKDGACAVCGGTIRPSELQVARSSQGIVFCTSCGRILYAG